MAVTSRRARRKIPQGEVHTEKWRLALDSLDQLHAWGVRVPLALADAGYGDCFEFRRGLEDRGLSYVVGVTGTLVAHLAAARSEQSAWAGRGRRPVPAYPDKPLPLAALAIAAGPGAARAVSWRQGSTTSAGRARTLRSRFVAIRVRPAGVAVSRHYRGQDLPECWLLAEWPRGADAPVQFWLSHLPAGTPIKTLVRQAKLRWRIEVLYGMVGVEIGSGRSVCRSKRADTCRRELWALLCLYQGPRDLVVRAARIDPGRISVPWVLDAVRRCVVTAFPPEQLPGAFAFPVGDLPAVLIRNRTHKRASPRITRRGAGNRPTRDDTHPATRKTGHETVFHKLTPR